MTPSGELARRSVWEVTKGRDHYLYYNGHGDLAAEADGSGTRTALHAYDPFGAPLDAPPANSTSHRFTGAWDKQDDSTSGLILMGARPYDPSLGRFLAVDPIDGGSLNNYDYAGEDPVNGYDLTGLKQQNTEGGEGGDPEVDDEDTPSGGNTRGGRPPTGQKLPTPEEINPGNLKNVDAKKLQEWTGQTAHAIKKEYLGESAPIAKYDIKYDPEHNVFVIVEHQTQRIVEVTYYQRW